MEEPVTQFRTLTSSDWREAIARSRRETNEVSEQIRAIISSSAPDKDQAQSQFNPES